MKTLLIGTILAVAWKLGPHIGIPYCLLIPYSWQPFDERCQESLCCGRARLPACVGMALNPRSCCHAMLIAERACKADAQQHGK